MARQLFYPGLEGLRGVSVLAVLLFHAEAVWIPGGFLGVSTFFTLSGFLITGLLVREWEQNQNIRISNFWARRLRRLLPASLLALLAIAVLGGALADPTQKERLSGDGLAALFYFSNWWLIVTGADYDNLMGSPSVIQHFWSLSIEEQYYFVYPVVAYAIFRATSGSRRIFGTVLSLATAFCWGWLFWLASTDASTARLYYGTDTRAGELLAGGVLALVFWDRGALPTGRLRSLVLAAGLLGLGITVWGWRIAEVESVGLYKGGFAVYTCGTLAIIAAAIQSGGPVTALLSWSPLRWVGRISYGAYVYHWPIFLWIDDNVVRIALTLLAAELSYRFLEEPIRSRRWLLGWGRFAAPPVAIGAVVLAFALALPGPKLPRAFSPDISKESALSTPLEPGIRIAIVGDSMAQTIGDGLSLWAQNSGQAMVLNLGLPACGIARGAWKEDDRRTAYCDGWLERTRSAFVDFKPDVVVATTAGWDLDERKLPEWDAPRVIGDPEFDRWIVEQYAEVFDVFRTFDARVVWLTTPCVKSPMGERTGVWDPARTRRMNDHILPALAAGREGELSVIDLDAAICPDGKFVQPLFGMEKIRSEDGIHLSDPGKLWVGTWLGDELVRAAATAQPSARKPL